MAEKYFVVFNRREQSAKQVENQTVEQAKLLPAKLTAPKSTGQLEDACVLFVEAETIAEAQRTVQHFYPGLVTGTPVVVATAQFKES
jgi:hypothetical protein